MPPLALVGLIATLSGVPSQERLPNPGFESGLTGWTTFAKAPDSAVFALESAGCRTGSTCLRASHRGERDWGVWPTGQTLPARPGEVWALTAWARIDSLPGSLTAGFVTRDSTGKVLSWAYAPSRFDRNASGWQSASAVLSVPSGCASIQPRLTGWGRGDAVLDDISFQKLSDPPVLDAPTTLAGDSLQVAIDPSNLSLLLIDRTRPDTVRSGAMPDFAIDSTRRAGDTLLLHLHHLRLGWPALLRARISGSRLLLRLEADSASPLSEPFLLPGPIATRAGQRLAMPRGTGLAWPVDRTPPLYSFWAADFWDWQVSQGLAGATDGQTGFVVSVDEPWDASVRWTRGATGLLEPQLAQVPSRHLFGHPRGVVVAPVRDGWAGIARVHRQRLAELGRVRTWSEKTRRDPRTERLRGAVDLWIRSNGWKGLTPAFFDTLRRQGIDRAIVNWTALSSSGKIDSIEAMGFVASAYKTFAGALPDPKYGETAGYGWGTLVYEDGTLAKGFDNHLPDSTIVWSMLNCPAIQGDLARAWFPRELATRPRHGQFLDVTLAGRLQECWSTTHPTTRGEDAAHRVRLLGLVRDSFGLLVGSEQTRDLAHAVVDWGEGPMSIAYTAGAPWDWTTPVPPEQQMDALSMDPAVRVPLLPLADHDAFAPTWYSGDGQSKVPARWDRKDAWNALYATMPLLQPTDRAMWDSLRPRYLRSGIVLAAIHSRCGFAAMTGFEERTADRTLQRTSFDNGWTVAANFADRIQEIDGTALPPDGFVATGPGGSVSRQILSGSEAWSVRLDDRWYLDPAGRSLELDGVRTAGPVFLRRTSDSTLELAILGDQESIDLLPGALPWASSFLASTSDLQTLPDGWRRLHRTASGLDLLRGRFDTGTRPAPAPPGLPTLRLVPRPSGMGLRWFQAQAGEARLEVRALDGSLAWSGRIAARQGANALDIPVALGLYRARFSSSAASSHP